MYGYDRTRDPVSDLICDTLEMPFDAVGYFIVLLCGLF